MKIIEKKKLYKGMAELRDEQLNKLLGNNERVKLVYDGQFMILTPHQLRTQKIFINTQKSIIHEGQVNAIYGFRWRPVGFVDEQLTINYEVKSRLSEEWKRITKAKGL